MRSVFETGQEGLGNCWGGWGGGECRGVQGPKVHIYVVEYCLYD